MAQSELSVLSQLLKKTFADKPPSTVRDIVIIDAMNMFMRSFHMVNHIDSDGDHIGGLSGFLKSVGGTIRLHKPSEVYIIFDGAGASTTKRMLYPEYKGNRAFTKISNPLLFKSKDQEREAIYNQAIRCIGYCKLLPVKVLCVDNMEADDVVGSIVKKFNQDETISTVTLVTEDRDYLQLINNKIKVYMPIRRKFADVKSVVEKYNAHPNNFAIYKSLVGDDGDNVPGVKGLGDKTVAKCFPFLREEKIYTLDDIYSHCLENVPEKPGKSNIFTKILAYKHQIDINYKLVNLHTIEFTDIDEQTIFDMIDRKELPYEPLTFLELYNLDGLGNSIPNTRMWLKEIFEPLKKRI